MALKKTGSPGAQGSHERCQEMPLADAVDGMLITEADLNSWCVVDSLLVLHQCLFEYLLIEALFIAFKQLTTQFGLFCIGFDDVR